MLAYLSPEGRVAFRERLADASHGRDVAWISAEGRGVVDLFPIEPPVGPEGIEASVLGLTRFHAGRVLDTALLGFVHPHGTWMDWRG